VDGERENNERDVEKEVLKAITQTSEATASRPCINQRWPKVWDSLPLLSRTESNRASDFTSMLVVTTNCGAESLSCVNPLLHEFPKT
jgi:hypothetical protein